MSRFARAIEVTGLGNGKGQLSFNKCVTLALCAVFAVAVLTRLDPSIALLAFGVVVQGAGFGLKGYMAGKDALRLTATHNATTQTTVAADVAQVVKALPDLWKDDESGGAHA